MTIPSNTKILTSAEAAKFLGLKSDTVRRYIQRKLITPLPQTVGRAYLITEKECRRFQRSRRGRGNPAFSQN